MAKYEVTVGAERLKPKKKRVWLKVIFSLIFGLLIGGSSVYYYYNYYLDNKDSSSKKEVKVVKKEKTTIEKEEEVDTDSYVIKKLMNGIHFSDGSLIQKTLYLEDKTVAKDLDSNYLDNLLLIEAYRTKSGFVDSVTIKDLEEARRNLFGSNYEVIIPTDKEVGTCPIFNYDVSTRTYSRSNIACSLSSDIDISYSTVKAEMILNKKITVYEVVAFISDQKVYKSIDGSNNLSDEIKIKDFDSFEIDDYIKELNQYKYNFKYDSDTDNYIFESIELVK